LHGADPQPNEEKIMSAFDVTALKVVACGVVAVAVTFVGSYAFVASTAVVRTVAAPAPVVAHASGIRLAQASSTDLLQ
jgi:hypothetical protein